MNDYAPPAKSFEERQAENFLNLLTNRNRVMLQGRPHKNRQYMTASLKWEQELYRLQQVNPEGFIFATKWMAAVDLKSCYPLGEDFLLSVALYFPPDTSDSAHLGEDFEEIPEDVLTKVFEVMVERGHYATQQELEKITTFLALRPHTPAEWIAQVLL